MVEQFLEYIKGNNLWKHGQTWVVAFSGGADSTALLHLCVEAGISVVAAHVHHGLRGEEADADAAFCAQTAQVLQIPYYEIRAIPGAFSHGGEGIQAQARDFRYRFFEQLIQEHAFDAVATAHHLHDQAETMLFRLFRGTGPFGLRGIMPRSGLRVHPLLWATPHQIRAYLQERGLTFREDSSNRTNDYARNYLRHEVLPPVLERFPDAPERMLQLASFNEASRLQIKFWQEQWEKRMVSLHPDGAHYVQTEAVAEAFPTAERLWFLLGHTGLSEETLDRILSCIRQHKVTGQLFPGKGWEIGLGKERLWWGPLAQYPQQPRHLVLGDEVVWGPYRIGIMKTDARSQDWVWSLALPPEWKANDLQVDRWHAGERLMVAGFGHHRKAADVLQALFMAPFRKAHYPVVRKEGVLVAIPGACASWETAPENVKAGSTIYLYFAFVDIKQENHHA